MITIDLEENNDCVCIENTSEPPQKEKNDSKFKRKLIFQVRKHPVLYDNKHKFFSNVDKKELVWQQIAKKIKSNVNDCKDTWFDLRYRYQCYARRLRNYFAEGHKKDVKRPAMGFESELIFLWRFVDHRKTCKLPFEIIEEETTEPEPAKVIQKKLDDDLILVEQPVELIVIDEDDDNLKSEKEFQVTPLMKNLIQQIKFYRELYDCQNLCFKDFSRRSYLWNVIANNLTDKATKLMKIWIVMQTRYEWEISQPNQKSTKVSELQAQMEFFKYFIIKNPDTVYKQSYYLKQAWYEPIDFFKDIHSLISRMKKMPDIVLVTDSLLATPEKTSQYIMLWTTMCTRNISPGQCETTWLIMRQFYWELMAMRQKNYQLTDKWYFETIITDLYAIAKTAVIKKNELVKLPIKRPAPTITELQETPAKKQFSPITTTTASITTISQPTPTIINNLQSIPATNSTLITQPIAQINAPLPKITAAISLAPHALNSVPLQIKQIPGPPMLSPAPVQFNLQNPPVSMSSTDMSSPQMSMSFSLPSQTRLTPIPMASLKPLPPANTQPTSNNIGTMFISSTQRQPLVRAYPPNRIQPVPPATILNSVPNPQPKNNKQPLNLDNKATLATIPPSQSIATCKITTLPSNVTSTSCSSNSALANTTIPTATTTTQPFADTNNTQLPKITGATSLLNPNEILIELISSQNGNQLVVHGPPLTDKYQLPMPTVAKLIREVLSIPLLHNKKHVQPALTNYYWDHIGNKFNLPAHICRACWNFLLENFNHFPQIAPMNELMKPFEPSLDVWKESLRLFEEFDELCSSKGWNQYQKSFPDVVESISAYPILYHDVSRQGSTQKVSDMERLCAWRTISLRFPKIPQIEEIWNAFKNCFVQYMTDLEFGIDNKWSMNWWRSLARLKFLVEVKYTQNEPLYYIVSNKVIQEIDKCAKVEMKRRSKAEQLSIEDDNKNNIELLDNTALEMAPHRKRANDVELVTLLTAIQKYPVIYGKADIYTKCEAWKKVAQILHMEVLDCLFAFQDATRRYFSYKKQDSLSRFRINEKYYKRFDDIISEVPSGKFSTGPGKINIKTFDLTDNSDLVFPERYISDINLSNSSSDLVVKNWSFALGNIPHFNEAYHTKMKNILRKYLPKVE